MLKRKPANRRRETRTPRWKLPAFNWPQLATAAAGVLALGAAAFGLRALLDQPIEQITVLGSFQRISALEIEKGARAHLHGAGLVSVDLDELRKALRGLDWIDQVSVERSWPRGLRIRVTEQVAVARWNKTGLVNASGKLFLEGARFIPPELPQLSGPAGTEADVVAFYQAAQGQVVEAGMRLASMRLDARGAWEMALDNGVVVRLGRLQPNERFQRFAATAMPLVSQRATDIAYVDMRYSNGFAVGWRGSSTRLARGRAIEDAQPDA